MGHDIGLPIMNVITKANRDFLSGLAQQWTYSEIINELKAKRHEYFGSAIALFCDRRSVTSLHLSMPLFPSFVCFVFI